MLVLEDRTEVKNEKEVGKLSVVSDIEYRRQGQTPDNRSHSRQPSRIFEVQWQGRTSEELHDQFPQTVQRTVPLWALQSSGKQCGARRRRVSWYASEQRFCREQAKTCYHALGLLYISALSYP